MVVDAPKQRVSEEGRAAGFWSWGHVFIEHGARPIAFGLLACCHSLCQTLVFVYEELVVLVGFRHVLQRLCQCCERPPVASRPEIFAPIGCLMFGEDVSAIAKVNARLGIEHDAICIKDVGVELIEMLLLCG